MDVTDGLTEEATMAEGVIPLGKIVYVCDEIERDPSTGKVTILGSFTSIRMEEGATYPLHRDKFCAELCP